MSFKEIIGQESAIALLKRSFSIRRVAHAYVFLGPEGIGKKKTALSFTSLLACEDTQKTDEACGRCPSCLKASSGAHPDIQWVYPDGQFVKIDAIREACRRLSLKGFESSFKALVIPEAGALNEESSNALLKTLEEPSRDSVIILIAPSIKSILPTIASRCQRVAFASLNPGALFKILQDKFEVGRQEAGYLAGISCGSLGLALHYHQKQLFARKDKIIDDALNAGLRLDAFLDLSKHERTQKKDLIEEVLAVLSSWFRDIFIVQVSGQSDNCINAGRKDDIMRAARDLSLADIEGRIKSIAESYEEIRRNVNVRLSLTKLRTELWKH
ncbi:MAG TPA: DNA polymerase III subunit delta' [Candidatus Omnitrophica bacterium]|nr:DNA polymerase III subunit delta' [Candidatus Omnitrophota bacterium]